MKMTLLGFNEIMMQKETNRGGANKKNRWDMEQRQEVQNKRDTNFQNKSKPQTATINNCEPELYLCFGLFGPVFVKLCLLLTFSGKEALIRLPRQDVVSLGAQAGGF